MIVQILNYLSCLDLNYELQVEIKFRWSVLKFVKKLINLIFTLLDKRHFHQGKGVLMLTCFKIS